MNGVKRALLCILTLVCFSCFVSLNAHAVYIGGLDLVSPSSTFEDVFANLPVSGWSNVSGTARIFDLQENGALISTDPYADYEVQYITGVPVEPNTLYTLHFDMGFMAVFENGIATYSFELGTVNESLVFSPLSAPVIGTVPYLGWLYHGVVSGSDTLLYTTSNVVSGDILAVRWAQTGTVRLSDYFGIDNVTLDAIPAKTVPETATILLLGAGIAGLVGFMRLRS